MKTSYLFLWNKYPQNYYPNIDSKKKIIIVNQGGTSCFEENTKIITSNGSIPIKDVKENDLILSYNENNNCEEFKKVLNVYKYKNFKKTVRIKLKNGTEIICTDDHEFFQGGTWISIKDLLSLWKQKK